MHSLFRISVAYIILTCFNSAPLVAMEAPIKISATLYDLNKKNFSKKELAIEGQSQDIIKDTVANKLKELNISYSTFDTYPISKDETLAIAYNELKTFGKTLTIHYSSNFITIQLLIKTQTPQCFKIDSTSSETLKDYLANQHHIDGSIGKITIGYKKILRKKHFLKKSIEKIHKQVGDTVISIECIPIKS